MKTTSVSKWKLPLDLVELHDEEVALIKGGGNENDLEYLLFRTI